MGCVELDRSLHATIPGADRNASGPPRRTGIPTPHEGRCTSFRRGRTNHYPPAIRPDRASALHAAPYRGSPSHGPPDGGTLRNAVHRACPGPSPLLIAVLAAACGSAAPVERTSSTRGAASELPGWSYDVRIAETGTVADVALCMRGVRPRVLQLGDVDASDSIDEIRSARTGAKLRLTARGFVGESVQSDDCLVYRVDFDQMAQGPGAGRLARRVGDSVLVRSTSWLLVPDEAPRDRDVTLRLRLPEGVEASVPWRPRPRSAGEPRIRTYELDRTAFRWMGYAAFGKLDLQRFEAAGSNVELTLLDAPVAADANTRRAWIEDAVETAGLLFGGYPRDRLQIVLVPVEGSGRRAVPFGMAGRGGGAGVVLLLDGNAAAERLTGGWTAIHELLHHGMPFVEDAWMAEGWVTYYTEVVRARRGHQSEQDGWQALWDGFERGARTSPGTTLRRASEAMHRQRAYPRVYWGGAAIAVLLDLELRMESDGARGLDDAMRELRRCCAEADRRVDAAELLAHLDAWHGRPLFSELADRQLDAPKFPDMRKALERLGITVHAGRVILDDAHPAAPIRRGIMTHRPTP
jgi:hypothetical protein